MTTEIDEMSADVDTIKRRLQRMENYDFEQFVGALWERQGWDCEVSQASNDAGIDVTATKSNPYPQKNSSKPNATMRIPQ